MSENYSGFVIGALQIGGSAVLIRPVKRGVFNAKKPDGSTLQDIIAQATIEERHTDFLEVTEHPVEQGASIADHAFKRPAEIVLRLGWSNSPSTSGSLASAAVGVGSAFNRGVALAAGAFQLGKAAQSVLSGSSVDQINSIYAQLLTLQESRALFTLYTGKRMYTNMICKVLSTETDYTSANTLPITMVCQQIILVNTQKVTLPANNQANPSATASPTNRGMVSPEQVS